MGIYRDLAQSPGVFRIIAAQLTARFPFGMVSIVMLLHIELIYGNYTYAGIILASQSIGQAVSGPVNSRMMGRWGMRPVITVTTIICASMLTTIALVPLPIWVIAILALFVGLTTPPVTPAVRTIYPKMVPSRLLSGLYSLDASLQEIIWIIGPVVAVFVSTQINTSTGLLVAVGFQVIGGAWFLTSPEVGRVRIPLSSRRIGAVFARPTVIVATVIGFLFVASFAAVEAGIVSAFGDDSINSGVVLAIFSSGSIIGGLLIGGRPLTPWSLFWRILIVAAGTLLCLFSLDMWWLSAVLFLGGFGVAPALAAIFTMVSSTVKFSETAEAFGWVGTGQLIGVAMGSAFAGFSIDIFGPMGAIVVSCVFLVLSAIAAAISSRWIPDLRGRDAFPLPDTAPITLPPFSPDR